MIKVWTDGAEAGLLDRLRDRGSAFLYLPAVSAERAVSVTMPVRLPSWEVPFGLAPIFEMNLPEGVLRERLRLTFAKATGTGTLKCSTADSVHFACKQTGKVTQPAPKTTAKK